VAQQKVARVKGALGRTSRLSRDDVSMLNNELEIMWKKAVVTKCKVLSLHLLRRTKVNHEKLDTHSPGQHMNPGPPNTKYKY
jgi:hypothetical protein